MEPAARIGMGFDRWLTSALRREHAEIVAEPLPDVILRALAEIGLEQPLDQPVLVEMDGMRGGHAR